MALAYGHLGSADLAENTDTLLYTCPANTVATVDIRITNRATAAISVRIAVGSGSSPTAADYLDYDSIVPGFTPIIESGVTLSAGEKVWVRTNTATANAQVRGAEETAQ